MPDLEARIRALVVGRRRTFHEGPWTNLELAQMTEAALFLLGEPLSEIRRQSAIQAACTGDLELARVFLAEAQKTEGQLYRDMVWAIRCLSPW